MRHTQLGYAAVSSFYTMIFILSTQIDQDKRMARMHNFMMVLATYIILATVMTSAANVSTGVFRRLEAEGRCNVVVEFGGNANVLKRFSWENTNKYADAEKVREALVAHAAAKQKAILHLLQTDTAAVGTKHESFWISNSLYIENATKTLLSKIWLLDRTVTIEISEPFVELPVAFKNQATGAANMTEKRRLSVQSPAQWGVARIGAPQLSM